jgi:membrane protein
LAILFVLTFVGPALFLASFAGSLMANLRTWLPAQSIPIGNGISFVMAILLDVALFMVLYIMLPHGASTWRELLPGAIGAGLLWELAKKAFLFFVTSYISVSNLVYGSVAAIFAFLVWAYLSGIIFLFGAYLSFSYYQLKQQQLEAAGQIHPQKADH